MLESTFVLVVLVAALTYVYRRLYGHESNSSNDPPGTFGWPFIGETLEFARKKVAFFTERHLQYGRVYKTHLFGQPTARAYGPDNVKKILLGENKYVVSYYPASVRILQGNYSISMSHGDEHFEKKRDLMKYLCPEFLHNHIPVISALISDRIDSWCSRPSVDLYTECRQLFIELSAKFLVKIDIEAADMKELSNQLDIFTENIFCLPINLPGFALRKGLQAKQRMRDVIVKTLNADSNNNHSEDQFSVLERMLGSTSGDADVTRDQPYIDTIIDLLFSGTESLSSSGFSLAYELLNNDTVLTNIRQEVDKFDLLSKEEIPSAHALFHMSYTDCVVKEGLRVMPPIGGGYRKVTESFELDGYTIPRDWSIVFSIRETHRNNPDIPECRKFNPDNWITGNAGKDKYAFVPFGGGVRVCPGQAYARLVLKLFTMELSRRCTARLLTDCEFTMWPTPRPSKQILAQFTSKNFSES